MIVLNSALQSAFSLELVIVHDNASSLFGLPMEGIQNKRKRLSSPSSAISIFRGERPRFYYCRSARNIPDGDIVSD